MTSEYVYNWNRIFGALALLVVLLGAGAFGVASLFFSDGEVPEVAQPDSPPTPAAVDAEAAAPDSPEPVPTTAGEGSTVVTAPATDLSAKPGQESVPEQASGSETKGDTDQTRVAIAPPESDPPAPVEEDSQQLTQPLEVGEALTDNPELGGQETGSPALEAPATDPAEAANEPTSLPTAAVPTPSPGLSPSTAAPLLASAAPLPDRDKAADPIASQASASAQHADSAQPAPHAVFEAGETRLFSPAVQRFSLANGVKNREPVADLQAVSFDENGLATAYAFSEVEGLMGSTLYYHWLHEGEQLAAVRIRVADQRWRSHSSKFINEAKTGVWTVQLRDAKGEVLAQADFTLRPQDPLGGQ